MVSTLQSVSSIRYPELNAFFVRFLFQMIDFIPEQAHEEYLENSSVVTAGGRNKSWHKTVLFYSLGFLNS